MVLHVVVCYTGDGGGVGVMVLDSCVCCSCLAIVIILSIVWVVLSVLSFLLVILLFPDVVVPGAVVGVGVCGVFALRCISCILALSVHVADVALVAGLLVMVFCSFSHGVAVAVGWVVEFTVVVVVGVVEVVVYCCDRISYCCCCVVVLLLLVLQAGGGGYMVVVVGAVWLLVCCCCC